MEVDHKKTSPEWEGFLSLWREGEFFTLSTVNKSFIDWGRSIYNISYKKNIFLKVLVVILKIIQHYFYYIFKKMSVHVFSNFKI